MPISKRHHRPITNLARRKRRRFWVSFGLVIFDVLVVIFSLVMAARLPYLQVENIVVSGNSSIDTGEIISSVSDKISGDYFKFIPKANTALVSTAFLAEDLSEKFPRIDSVEVSRTGTHILSVSIKERRPFGMWCGDDFKTDYSDSCYFMDGNGLIYGAAPNFSGDVFVRYYGGIGTSTPIGSNYIGDNFKNLPLFMSGLSGLGIKVTDFVTLTDGEYNIYVNNGAKILFNNDQGFDKTLESLKTLSNSNGISLNLSDLKLDYVDLRFGNKIFYREK